MTFKRRDFIKFSALLATSAGLTPMLSACAGKKPLAGETSTPKVIVIGGGFGGVKAAKTVKEINPQIDVTLIEKDRFYTTCPGSNWVLGGTHSLNDITFNYHKIENDHNINVVYDEVIGLDPDNQIVFMKSGHNRRYDRLIVSPGISFRWDKVEGHDESTSYLVPHAWRAGYQTLQLKHQLENMQDGGVVAVCSPPNPFRCPPGPYERASMIAYYLKKHKPKSKLLILDAKNAFSKQGMFISGWEAQYGYGSDNALLEWVPADMGGFVTGIDPHNKVITTDQGDKIKADVINYIPHQRAHDTAAILGLTDASGWCPVDQLTFESTQVANVHVIGDSVIAGPMPKSGFAANSQARVCATAVARLLSGESVNPAPYWTNQCFSVVSPEYAISVMGKYDLQEQKIHQTGGGLFPQDGNFKLEYEKAKSWYAAITYDMFFS